MPKKTLTLHVVRLSKGNTMNGVLPILVEFNSMEDMMKFWRMRKLCVLPMTKWENKTTDSG